MHIIQTGISIPLIMIVDYYYQFYIYNDSLIRRICSSIEEDLLSEVIREEYQVSCTWKQV